MVQIFIAFGKLPYVYINFCLSFKFSQTYCDLLGKVRKTNYPQRVAMRVDKLIGTHFFNLRILMECFTDTSRSVFTERRHWHIYVHDDLPSQ